jgi:hypothetical protein
MLFSLIIFVAVIMIIINGRMQQSGTENNYDYKYSNRDGRPNTMQGSVPPQSGISGGTAGTAAGMKSGISVRAAGGTSGTATGMKSGTSVRAAREAVDRTAGGTTAYTAARDEKKATSTMAYLDEKAKQDQKEHAMEKMQEQKRTSEKYGNRSVGGRYLLGDPIPKGMKIVYCEYCGAENLVKIDYRNDRDCYFCRTHLED